MNSNFILATTLDTATLNLYKNHNIFLPLITGSLAYYTLNNSIQHTGILRANSLWNVQSTILGALTGVLIWNEKLTTKSLIGIGLGIASMYLIDNI